jgi:ribosome-associated toxin RatA of RatAB toxin-antitoxin module
MGKDVMRHTIRLTLLIHLLMLLGASTNVLAGESACADRPQGEPSATTWILSANTDAICVYTHAAENSNIHEIRAEATLAASPARVFSVIADYGRYPDFMPYVKTSEVIQSAEDASWVFQQLALPFPVSDRYYTIRLVADKHLAGEGGYRVDWTLAGPEVPGRTGSGVPVLTNTGYWKLQPVDDGKATHVTYFIHTDPGGALPAWVINIANKESAPSVVKAVRARVAALGVNAPDPSQ